MKPQFQTLLRTAAVALLVCLGSAQAFALDLADAKSQGLVGEKADGLVGIVKPPGDATVQALVSQTNAGRLELYRQQATQTNVSLPQYQAVAGGNLISRTPSGQYVNTGSGWTKK